MESGELGIVADIWERDTAPVKDLENMLFEHLLNQGYSVIIIGSGKTMMGRCEISSEKPERQDEPIWEQCEPIVESIEKSWALMEQIKLSAYKDCYEDLMLEPRAKFDHYCDKAIYRAKNEVIKRTIIPRRKRIRIHGRKK